MRHQSYFEANFFSFQRVCKPSAEFQSFRTSINVGYKLLHRSQASLMDFLTEPWSFTFGTFYIWKSQIPSYFLLLSVPEDLAMIS